MISFVILHYKNIKDTIECLDSIKNIKTTKKISIIVVDNNTLSDTDENRIKKYTTDIIKLDDNLGFAKANNIGSKYAIEKYKPDFICVINNDTIIEQSKFIDEIYECYNKTNFDVMGPKIITNGGESVNPFPAYNSLEIINEKIKYTKKLIKIYNNVLLRNLLVIYMKIKKIFKKPIHLTNGKESSLNVSLHGCAVIFSKKYYQKFSDVFYNGTFLYHEEEFLEYRRKKNNLLFYYDSNLEIFHKESASLNDKFKNNNYQKLIFRNKEILKSLELLKRVYEQGE